MAAMTPDTSRPLGALNGANANSARPLALLLAIVLYLAFLWFVLAGSLSRTGGQLVYASDDAYIHMAIAKNLARHGIFGVTSHGFVSASSSIAWPLLLAVCFKAVGLLVVIPLLWQLVFSIGILWLTFTVLKAFGIQSTGYATTVLCGLVLFVPMVTLTLVAMEHLLHTLATLAMAWLALHYFERPSSRSLALLAMAAAALTSVRYEGAFLVAATAVLLACQKRWWSAVVVSATGALPLVLFGLYSRAHGGFFLPNSLILKHQPIGFGTLCRLRMVGECPELLVLGIAAVLLLALRDAVSTQARRLLQLFLLTWLAHQMLAAYGWFYRYEAYLIALGWVGVAVAGWEAFPALNLRRGWKWLAVAALLLPLVSRAVQSTIETPKAIVDIYRQQFQMGQFFRRYFPTAHIAANDIGAICFYADPYLTDLTGLGDTEVVNARIADHRVGSFQRYRLRSSPTVLSVVTSRSLQFVAIYPGWYGLQDGVLPEGWVPVGGWEVPELTVLGSQAVEFFGVGADSTVQFCRALAENDSRLPAAVHHFIVP